MTECDYAHLQESINDIVESVRLTELHYTIITASDVRHLRNWGNK